MINYQETDFGIIASTSPKSHVRMSVLLDRESLRFMNAEQREQWAVHELWGLLRRRARQCPITSNAG